MNLLHFYRIVDNLPVATVINPAQSGDVYYDLGYRLGWIGDNAKVFLNNHLQFVVKYHQHTPGLYRLVFFLLKKYFMKQPV